MSAALDAALVIGQRWEGLHKVAVYKPVIQVVPYICPANILTIGWGHTGKDVTRDLVWTREQADEALRLDMGSALSHALVLCPSLSTASTGRQAAIADFVFNLGPGRLKASTLRRKINDGAWDEVPDELRKWVWGGGKKLPGLILRREAEVLLVRQAD